MTRVEINYIYHTIIEGEGHYTLFMKFPSYELCQAWTNAVHRVKMIGAVATARRAQYNLQDQPTFDEKIKANDANALEVVDRYWDFLRAIEGFQVAAQGNNQIPLDIVLSYKIVRTNLFERLRLRRPLPPAYAFLEDTGRYLDDHEFEELQSRYPVNCVIFATYDDE